jgi:hypothetical protein
LRDRPDAWVDELHNRTFEPGNGHLPETKRASDFVARTGEPEPANANAVKCTPEPGPPILNRRLAVLARKQRAA